MTANPNGDSMKRREFLRLATVGAATLGGCRWSGMTADHLPFTGNNKDSRPNILFIICDDMGYGDLGCYGATKIKTPNIDGLARDGVRFTDAHSPAAMCTPTRYGLMTGRYHCRGELQ